MKSNETHVQTSSDSETVDDMQAALFMLHLESRFRDAETGPIQKEIGTWVDKQR
jgi:hypothetical protein